MTINANIQDFPETDYGAIKVYGEKSYENAVAALSHKLHHIQSSGKYSDNDRVEILRLMKDYFDFKKNEERTSDEYMSMVADNPFETDIFQEFFDVPFKSPMFI